ncbi:DUF2341 domain-containing protein [Candidatus Parcubacteria bacterium]|nr:MAG: DUF2341 domain-containing protein [Candidatus Parcubacteria bacterium]
MNQLKGKNRILLIVGVFILLWIFADTLGIKHVQATSGWWDDNWQNRRKITFNNASSSENLLNFPILVSLTSSNIDYSKTKTGGADIRFIDTDNNTALNYEIEKWDKTATSSIWVKVPQIDGTSSTDYIWMYYNNPNAIDNSTTTGVWDSNFKFVHHFGPTDASASDSTQNAFNGTVTDATAIASPIAGNSKDFDLSSTQITLGNLTITDNQGEITISAWINKDTNSGNDAIYSNFNTGAVNGALLRTGAANIEALWKNSAGTVFGGDIGLTASVGAWQHVVFRLSLSEGKLSGYKNGVEGGTTYTPTGDANDTNSNEDIFGTSPHDLTQDFDGKIDEIRFSSTARSNSWILAEYKNGVNTFNSFGSEESNLWWNALWQGRRKITFNNASSSENLVNFPVLVALNATNSTNIDYSKTQNSGQDIRFIDSDNLTQLNYEIELWDETATSYAWVKVPQIDASSSTDYIWMYFNNTSASDNSTTTGVWDSNFRMVQHFGSTDSSATDSTQYVNNGTVTNAVATTSSIIAYAKNFDGADDVIAVATSSSTNDLAPITISTWIYPRSEGESDRGCIVCKGNGGVGPWLWRMAPSATNTLTFSADFDGATDLNRQATNNSLNLNQWQYVAMFWDGSQTATSSTKFYVNGTEVIYGGFNTAGAGNRITDITYKLRIGDQENSANSFDGMIDEVRLSGATRSASWILAEYKNGVNTFNTFFPSEETLGFSQKDYRWYQNADTLQPTSSLALINTETTINSTSSPVRLRVNTTSHSTLATSSQAFKLQYSQSTSGAWNDVGTWWNTNWKNRRKITFNNSASSENLVDFPVLVSLNATTSANIDYSKTQNSGQDIRFVDADDQTALNYEIELWDESATSSVWVRVPQINGTSSTDYVWMYYNNSTAIDNSTTSGVWDSNFKLVTHFGSTDASATDSTLNAVNGTVNGAVATTSNVVAGYGKKLDGANDNINYGTSSAINDLNSGKTISLWLKRDATGGNSLFTKDFPNSTWELQIRSTNDLRYSHQWTSSLGSWITSNTFTSTAQIYHFAVTYNAGATTNDPTLYANGTAQSLATDTNPTSGSPNSDASDPLISGEQGSGGGDTNGIVDEIRYSNVIRSAEWLEAEYKNGVNTYNTFGSEEGVSNITWLFSDNTSVGDGATISTTLLTNSELGQSYEETNNATSNPRAIPSGQEGEWDFVLNPFNATTTTYYFRMVKSDGTIFNQYQNYPTLTIFGSQTSPWWNINWHNRRKITFDNASSSENLVNFPVLVILNATNSSNIDYSKTQSSGQDVRFIDSDNSTELNYEIELWDETATSYVWVKVPSVATGSADFIYMYYNNTSASDNSTTTGVWDSSYKGVWHLKEGYSTSSAFYKDSTLNVNHATLTDSDGDTTTTSLVIDGGIDFNGDGDLLTVSATSSINNFTQRTVSFWVHRDGCATTSCILFQKQNGFAIEIRRDNGSAGPGTTRFSHIWSGSPGTIAIWFSSTVLSTSSGVFYHVVVTYDKSSTANDPSIYVNGIAESITESQAPSGTAGDDTINDLSIGSNGGTEHLDGILDEIRYSNILRSASWILAEYKNGVNSFNTFVSEESVGGASQTPILTQTHYRWRNDDGNEANATFAASTDTALENFAKRSPIRLRTQISNEGNVSSGQAQYQLEYGQKTTSCSSITSWTKMPNTGNASNEHWSLVHISNVNNGASTTNNSNIVDENTTFVAGEFRSTSNITSAISLSTSEFTELEWALWAEQNAIDGSSYCFRVTNRGSSTNLAYGVYPEISLRAGGTISGLSPFGGSPPATTPTTGGTTGSGVGASDGGPGGGSGQTTGGTQGGGVSGAP